MTGFERELQRKVIGFDAHVILTTQGLLTDWRELADEASNVDEVIAVAPYVQGPVLVEFRNQRVAPKIRAIDPELESKIGDLSQFIIAGDLDLEGDNCVVGSELARLLGLGVGDILTVFSPENMEAVMRELEELEAVEGGADREKISGLRELIAPQDLLVTGIFESGRFLYDSEFLLVPLHIGQELYGLPGDVHGLAVRTSDPFRAAEVQLAMEKILPPGVSALTWVDLNRQIFDAIKMERNVMFFLLMFIILVAAFGIMNTLITVTVQKTREIGILKALGAQTFQIVGVFLAQGMVVGFFGTLSGLGLGMALVRWRNETRDFLAAVLNVEVFPSSVYQFNEIPAEVIPSDVAIICVSAFVICSVAALIPAYFAARLDPVKALRFE